MKERWPEMLEYQQKVQAMTDLERAYALIGAWVSDEHRELRLIGKSQAHLPALAQTVADVLAAARREGAEAALAELNEALSNGDPEAWRKVDIGIPKAVAAAERRGAEAERCNIDEMLDVAYRHGAEAMRERAAQVAAKYDATSPSNVGNIHPDYFYGQENAADGIADAIRALPLTPEEPE